MSTSPVTHCNKYMYMDCICIVTMDPGTWKESYSSAPLWEGQSCSQRLWWTKQCCEERNPPHFVRDLPAPTTDGIEVRLCSYYFSQVSDVPLEIVEIYVQ